MTSIIADMPYDYFWNISDALVKLNKIGSWVNNSVLIFHFYVCRIGLQIQMVGQKEKNRFEGLWLKLGK